MAVVRQAIRADAPEIARLLHDFNLEFGDPSPGVEVLTGRIVECIEGDLKSYLLGAEDGGEPVGVAQVSFVRSIWRERPLAHLDELYVAPASRGRGVGRALMTALLALARERGACGLEVVTGEDDAEARALYESVGMRNEIEGAENSRALFYELELE